MTITKMRQTSKIVEQLLREDEKTREDDCYLMLKVFQITHPEELGKTFADALFNGQKNGINFETIRRSRAQIQSKHPELKPRKEVEKAREEVREVYEEFVRE